MKIILPVEYAKCILYTNVKVKLKRELMKAEERRLCKFILTQRIYRNVNGGKYSSPFRN
jgi:hypothetical protein